MGKVRRQRARVMHPPRAAFDLMQLINECLFAYFRRAWRVVGCQVPLLESTGGNGFLWYVICVEFKSYFLIQFHLHFPFYLGDV